MDRNKVLEEFYKREYNNLVKRVNRRAGTPENAEDVVQESFYRAIKYWDSYDDTKKTIGAWFNTILNNALKDFKRDELNYGMCLELDEEQLDGVEMSQTDGDMLKRIGMFIDGKNESHREILDLYFHKGYKPREIAQITDVDNKTIRMAIWRFKEDVKEKLIDR